MVGRPSSEPEPRVSPFFQMAIRVPLWLVLSTFAAFALLLRLESSATAPPPGLEPGELPTARFGLVHVPKTGGLAVRHALGDRCDDIVIERRAHSTAESDVLKVGLRPLVVLRAPLERLQSSFDFWQQGSSELSALSRGNPQATLLLKPARRLPWEGFLDGLLNGSSPHRATAQLIVNAPQALASWAWSAHFHPLRRFVDKEDPRSVYVCYSRRLLAQRLACMAAAVGVRCLFNATGNVNPTRRQKRAASAEPVVPPHLLAPLQRYLSDDEAIFRRHCGACAAEASCCHSGRDAAGGAQGRRPRDLHSTFPVK